MNEHEIRLAAYALKLSPAVKLTLLGVISRVNWETWRGEISFRDISQRMNLSASSVRSSLKKLNEAGLITSRLNATTTAAGKQMYKRTVVDVNVKMILGVSQIDTPPVSQIDTPPVSRIDTPPVSRIDTPPLSIRDTLTIEDNNLNTIKNTIRPVMTERQLREQRIRDAKKRMNSTYRSH